MSHRRAGVAAFQGIAGAQLVGLGIIALDDAQERDQLQGWLPNAREHAEAAPCRTSFVPPGVLAGPACGVAVAAASAWPVAGTTSTFAIAGDMVSDRPSPAYDRAVERRRAVALARHFREAEGLSIAQIADRLGRSPATIKAYFYDPTGEKARAVKARYQGVCRGCGAPTAARGGKGDAYAVLQLRREAPCCIPGAAGRNSKGCSWVQWLTRI